MKNLCNFYRFLSLARLLIPRVFVFRRLWSSNKRTFLSALRFSSALCLSFAIIPRIFVFQRLCSFQQAHFSLRSPFLFLPCVFLISTRVFFLYGAFGLTASALFSPLSVSLSALCLSFAIIPRVFVFQRLCSFQHAHFSLRSPFLFQPRVFPSQSRAFLLFGAFGLTASALFSTAPRPVSFFLSFHILSA